MNRASKFSRKILAILITFSLVFQQAGFAQLLPQTGVPAYLNGLIAADPFRPVQLRSLSYDPLNNNFALFLDKGDTKELTPAQVQANISKLMEYFRIGLALPNSKFWVNLRPDSAGEILDPSLENTDLGKVLLEADLQLKKDMANFTSPNTPEGRGYWTKVYEKAAELFGYGEMDIPTLTRPWIVPGEVIIRQNKTSAYIYKATLKVMLEQDYLKDSPQYGFDDPRLKELNVYSSQLIREIVIPKLTREVNSSKNYSALRQAYYSLIMAQWFKQGFQDQPGTTASFIDTNNLAGLTSRTPWDKDAYFKAYQRSFTKGEYDQRENVSGLSGMKIRRYFSGGIVPVVSANTVQLKLNGDPGSAQAGLLRVDLPGDDLSASGVVRPAEPKDARIGKGDGGLAGAAFLVDLAEITNTALPEYQRIKNIYKKLLSVNDVKAIYDLENAINRLEKGEKKELKAKYQDLKREAVWEYVGQDKNNPLRGLLLALQEKENSNLLSKTEVRDTLVRVNDWLSRPGYQGYLVNKLKSMIASQSWQALIQCFYMVVDFGTAGKRGQQVEKDRASADVLPGPNIINDYTVAEYAYAQARYLLATGQAQRGVVLGGDTRIKSSLPRVHKGQSEQAYTDLQSEILRKMGVKVYRFPEPRSIAEAAWATVMLDAASMAYNSASHNLWHDNGVKASNEFSSQLFAKEKDAYKAYLEEVLPEDIAALEGAPLKAEEVILNVDKAVIAGAEVADVDGQYIRAIRSFVTDNDIIRENSGKVRSFYSPVQGSGVYTIPRMLNDGQDFKFDVTVSRLQRYQDTEGQFITVDKPDPAYEDEKTQKRTIDVAVKEAEGIEKEEIVRGRTDFKFDFVCATDPDSDRSVFAVRDNQGSWKMLKANDVWALLGWYMLKQRKAQNKLPEYAIKTWVTTDLVKEIAEDPEFGLKVIEPAVGFNKIAEVALKEIGIPGLLGEAPSRDFMKKVAALEKDGKPLTLDLIARESGKTRSEAIKEINAILKEKLLFGVEESNGFSPGGHTLEKDAAVAVVVFHEVAAYAKKLNEAIQSEDMGRLNDSELAADLFSFVKNNPGQELTVYNLLNMLYLKYGYFATENKPLTFEDSPQGRQKKEIVLSHLKNRLGHAEAVKFGDRQVVRIKTGNQYMNGGYVENGEMIGGHGTKLVFNEPGYRFELDQTGADYITFRPSGTEPYIRTYGQLKVASGRLTWQNIEEEKVNADKAVTGIVMKAQGYAQQNTKFAKDWQDMRAIARAGFKTATTVYQAVFDQAQANAFGEYLKGYKWPGRSEPAPEMITRVPDLKASAEAAQEKKKVIGNGLGVLSVARQYGQNLAKGLKLDNGRHNLAEVLSGPQARDFLHNVIITSGGQAQRNAKYSQIGKCLAKIPMSEKDRQEARYILDGLLDIAVNIEKNYSADEFMFAIIYGDALISFDPQDLADKLADKQTRDNLACLLLKMDYKTSPSYGFAKLNDKADRVELFQEKYNQIKRDDKGNIADKVEEIAAIRDLGTDEQKALLTELLATKNIDILEKIFPDKESRYDLMRRWLDKNGYLTSDDKIYMNPAFSIMGIKAFLRTAFLAGLTDKDGNIEVNNGQVVYQADSYLSLALGGRLPDQKADSKINIDYYGNIVPSFANQAKPNLISDAINAKGALYAVPFDGVWYDTGDINGEKEINLRQAAKPEDANKVLQVADTYDLQPSVDSRMRIAGENAANYGMDSWVEAKDASADPLSIQVDSYVRIADQGEGQNQGKLVLGKNSQLYNVLLANAPSLEVGDNYVLTFSTLSRDGNDYIVPVLWDHRDDMKKGYFGGRTDQSDPDSAVLIAEWAKAKGLAAEKIIDGYAKKEEAVNAKTENERKLAWRDSVDLYSAKLFPIISVAGFNAWNSAGIEAVADPYEKGLLSELPEILRFLQHKVVDAPEKYKEAVAGGRVASRSDTYNNQAPGALFQLRNDIKDAVDIAFGNKQAAEKSFPGKIQDNGKKGGDNDPAEKSADPLAPGGVDFRAIPLGGQMIRPIPLTPRAAELVNNASIRDLERKWQEIRHQMAWGSMPYNELKDYVVVCSQRLDTSKQVEELQGWVNNILLLEESAAVPTSQELKEVLLTLG